MLVDFRGGRRSGCALLLLAIFILVTSVSYLGHPYVTTIQAQFPEFKDAITAKLDSLHMPIPGSGSRPQSSDPVSSLTTNLAPHDTSNSNAAAEALWAKLQPLLDDNPPEAEEIEGWDIGRLDFTDFSPDDQTYTEDILDLKAMDVVRMRHAHRNFVDGLQKQFPKNTPGSNNASRGIVTTAAGYYLPVFMVSLRMLRRRGTNLPVEVWMNTPDEYEPYICEKVLPTMNAKCRILDDILRHHGEKYTMRKEIEHFQFKIFAILFSNFQDILWLDADNFAMQPADQLFDQEPYLSSGMVIWPDFWYRTVSPTYHLINDNEPEHRGVRPAAETGQMLLNKATHLQVLLLAAYYNYYGPSHYYGLLCQNGPGRGDKETFVPAAKTLNMSFYQVREGVKAVGHDIMTADGIWIFAMIQYNPFEDFHRHPSIKDVGASDDTGPPTPMFLHCNTPKWNPKNVFDHPGVYDLTWDVYRNPAPAFQSPADVVETLGGIEREMWDEVKWVACELEHDFKDFEDGENICEKVVTYFKNYLYPLHGEVWTGEEPAGGPKNNDKARPAHGEPADTAGEHLVMSNAGEVKGASEQIGDTTKGRRMVERTGLARPLVRRQGATEYAIEHA